MTKTEFYSRLRNISIFITNRKVFFAVLLAVSTLKLLLLALAPASFELRDIVHLFNSANAPLGPWVAFYPPLYMPWIPRDIFEQWFTSPPATMDLNLTLLSLLFRLPTLAFDLAAVWALCFAGAKLGSPDKGRLAGLIWFLNPYSLLSIELLGVPDVVVIFLTVLSVGLIISRRALLAAAIIGLGIFIKLFPLLLIPPIFLYMSSQRFSKRRVAAALGITLLGLVGYLSWVLPHSLGYLTDYSPVTQPTPFFVGAPVLIGTGYSVNASTFGMIAFYCLLILLAKRDALIPMLVSTLMLYYLLSTGGLPYPQYLLWALPLIALDVAFVNRSRAFVAAAFYALAFARWFFTSFAFITPSGYSLLMIPLGGLNPPSYVLGLREFLQSNPLLNVIILPLVYSGLFASTLIYAIDAARSWFALPSPKHP